jgi:hypothetical protein
MSESEFFVKWPKPEPLAANVLVSGKVKQQLPGVIQVAGRNIE